MLNKQDYLLNTTFEEVISLELKNENRLYFYLRNIRRTELYS